MVVGPDPNVSQIIEGLDVEDGFATAMDAVDTNGIAELLVEIAVVNLPVPTNVDGVQTHEFLDGIGIEIPHQQVHVLGEFPPPVQEIGKPLDGHVGDRKELIEKNPKVLGELFLVLDLEFFLRGWQEGAERVVDQIELEAGGYFFRCFVVFVVLPVPSVPRLVQGQQGRDRSLKDASSPLGVDVLRRVAREAGNHVNVVFL
mmetsp:Transcript_26044/g.55809  ORF Transcript_26044/g.55809 Transcript_26044/m.55809 type:complete len:201 (-) Transcript_26044:1001-1603(-)